MPPQETCLRLLRYELNWTISNRFPQRHCSLLVKESNPWFIAHDSWLISYHNSFWLSPFFLILFIFEQLMRKQTFIKGDFNLYVFTKSESWFSINYPFAHLSERSKSRIHLDKNLCLSNKRIWSRPYSINRKPTGPLMSCTQALKPNGCSIQAY